MSDPVYLVLHPARTLGIIFILIKLIWFFGNISYVGVVKSKTVTLLGVRKGLIARIYGFFYFIVCVFFLLLFPLLFMNLFGYSWFLIMKSFLYSFRFPYRGYLFVGISIIGIVIREIKIYLSKRKRAMNKESFDSLDKERDQSNWVYFLFLGIGLRDLFGLPYLVEFVTFITFFYFSPMLSVKRINKFILNQ